LQSAYRRNFPGSRAIVADTRDIERSDWRQLIGRVRPDAVIGGPPCQGFSWIGKRRKDDPRNTLIYDFYRHVDLLRPKFFLMENVEGLLQSEAAGLLSAALESVAGIYSVVGPLIVNAADYGAATKRTRVIVIGYDPGEVDPITPGDVVPGMPGQLVTVRDAIADLPNPIGGQCDRGDFGWGKYPAQIIKYLSEYAGLCRSAAPAGLGWREAVDRHSLGYISGLAATRHSGEVARRYAIVAGGKTDRITKSVRLQWDGQCPTLRAGTGYERGAFQAVRPLHPGKSRVITVREAARLQGFPDWFVFHPTKWHSFRMIGNSVCPPLARGLFERLIPKMRVSLA
jgi:DNA (cytosine-5)-methyltransferase 1